MSSLYLILGLVFSLIIALVAIANTEPVTVNYIFGQANVPLILLILGSAFAGALVMGLFSLFRSIRSAFTFRHVRQEKEQLQKQVKDLEEEKIFLEAELNKAVSVPEEPEGEVREKDTEGGQTTPGENEEKKNNNQQAEENEEDADDNPL